MHVNHCEKLCGLCHSLMDNSAAAQSIKDTIIAKKKITPHSLKEDLKICTYIKSHARTPSV